MARPARKDRNAPVLVVLAIAVMLPASFAGASTPAAPKVKCDHALPQALEALAKASALEGDRGLMKVEGCKKPAASLEKGAKSGCAYAKRSLARIADLAKKKDRVKHFGGDFGLLGFVELDQLVKNPARYQGRVVKVAARVDSVCKKKGCWLVLDALGKKTAQVRIRMKDYGFFVPVNSDGKEAIVEGVFHVKNLSEAMAKHYAEDAGKDSSKVKGARPELSMTATAIDIIDR